MSTFSNNPRLLTKDELKSELKANGIPLPRAEQRKAYYVDLYLERLTSQNQNEEFLSIDKEWEHLLQENIQDNDFEDIDNISSDSEKDIQLKL